MSRPKGSKNKQSEKKPKAVVSRETVEVHRIHNSRETTEEIEVEKPKKLTEKQEESGRGESLRLPYTQNKSNPEVAVTGTPSLVLVESPNTYDARSKESIGIVGFAFGHPYYAHSWYNLAVSLKTFNSNIPITLVKEEGSLNQLEPDQLKIFDNIIECDPEWIKGKAGVDYYKAKLFLDIISPYERTLFLDADMVWNHRKSPADLFDLLDGITFTCANRGRTSTIDGQLRSQWTSLSDVKKYYDLDYIYDISSEVIYFERTKVFEKAREIYQSNEMPVSKFGNGLPDEVWLSLAIEKTKTILHESPWFPTYWQPFYFTKIHNEEFILNHYALSLGGAFMHERIRKLYNHIIQSHFTRARIKRIPYQAVNKSKIMRERAHI